MTGGVAAQDAGAGAPLHAGIRTLVAWFPDWPLTAAGLGADTPAAVVHANRVVACSAAARAAGVGRGLRRREAQARCPDLTVLAPDPAGEARAFEPVVAVLERAVCPRIEVVRPGLCALAVRGPARWFGGDQEAAAAVLAAVSEPGTGTGPGLCRVGVADGPFAAGLAARRGRPVAVVPPGASPAFLASLPVRTLGDPELADLLGRLGIRTLGALAALPAAHVLARFGPAGAAAHRLARGLDERPLDVRAPSAELSAELVLDPPAERVDAAAFAAKRLADQVHAELTSRGLACSRIRIEAHTEHGEQLIRVWRHDGSLTPAAVADRVRWQLDGWLSGTSEVTERPTAGISLLRLVPDEVHPDHGRQGAFWGGTTLADERAARALARIQGLLHPGAVGTPVLIGGRGPAERAVLVAWGDDRRVAAGDRPAAPWPGTVPPPAPAVVPDRPVPVELTDRAGRSVLVTGRALLSAPPARLVVGSSSPAAVVAWGGPWPVEERWWDPAAHRRRARLQLLTASGAAHLVAVEGGKWWLEASYD